MNHEASRHAFRPDRIATLFIGESVPKNGKFFYDGGTKMEAHMRTVMAPSSNNFLETFKERGWYLDDLVLTPVDQIKNRKVRKAACAAARVSLAQRIAEYKPQVIVAIQLSIREDVEAAVAMAGSDAKVYHTCFPGVGNQGKFIKAMAQIMPHLSTNQKEI